VALISAMEPDLDSDPGRVLFRQMMGAIAQYDRTMLTMKLKVARERKRAATGKCEGRKFYGDLPGEAEIRDRIRATRKAGAGLQAICDALNGEGVRTRFGRQWMPMTVARIAER
jgi:DNA invertase Pin-like site-specific DNA recombinase